MIYEHALLGVRVAVGWDGTWDFGRRELERTPYALLRTCRRVYADIAHVWPQWCVLDLGPLSRYNSVKMLDVLSVVPKATMQNLRTLCVPAFHIQVYRPSPWPDQLYNGFSFFGKFPNLNLDRLLLRWDDTISSPSSPQNHDYQYGVIREQLVQYGTGWRELYLATPFKSVIRALDLEIKRRDGQDSGACAVLHPVQGNNLPYALEPEFNILYDALVPATATVVAHIVVVKRGRDVNIHERTASTPTINDIHTQIQWHRGVDQWSDESAYSTLRQTFIIEPSARRSVATLND